MHLAWVAGFPALTRRTCVGTRDSNAGDSEIFLELEFERVNLLHTAITNHDWVTIRSEPKTTSKNIRGLRKVFETYNLFDLPILNTDADNSWRASVADSHIDVLAIGRPQVISKQFALRQAGPLVGLRVKQQ